MRKVSIIKTIKLPIHLALAGNKGATLAGLRTIYSHAQPLLQARGFLRRVLPSACLVPVASTVAALERVKKEGRTDAAAIASAEAARAMGLKILKQGVEDNKTNATTFAVISKKPHIPPCHSCGGRNLFQTSIAFNFPKDAPGSLVKVLEDFAAAGINLTKIESRPTPMLRAARRPDPRVSGTYVFYIDFSGSPTNPNVASTLSQIKKRVATLKVLGTYL
jgi:prephenate dehydratase